jgi:hypothetical protein
MDLILRDNFFHKYIENLRTYKNQRLCIGASCTGLPPSDLDGSSGKREETKLGENRVEQPPKCLRLASSEASLLSNYSREYRNVFMIIYVCKRRLGDK